MNPETMQLNTAVYFRDDYDEFVRGIWTGFRARNEDASDLLYVVSCDLCGCLHALPGEDIYPIPEVPDHLPTPLSYRERLQIEEDEAQAEYLSRHAGESKGRHAAFAFPLVVAGLCAMVVGGVSIADGNYGFGILGVLLFVGAFLFADRLERGV